MFLLGSVSCTGHADVEHKWKKSPADPDKNKSKRESVMGEKGKVHFEAGDAPLALPIAPTAGVFPISPFGGCHLSGCCLSSAFSPHESVTAQGHLFKEMWRILASQDPPLCLPCQAASDMWCLATVRRQNGNGSLCTSDLRTVGCSVVLLQLCQNARTFHLHFEESAKTRARNKHQEYW